MNQPNNKPEPALPQGKRLLKLSDICRCGDYRSQHENYSGKCRACDRQKNAWDGCLEFRLSREATADDEKHWNQYHKARHEPSEPALPASPSGESEPQFFKDHLGNALFCGEELKILEEVAERVGMTPYGALRHILRAAAPVPVLPRPLWHELYDFGIEHKAWCAVGNGPDRKCNCGLTELRAKVAALEINKVAAPLRSEEPSREQLDSLAKQLYDSDVCDGIKWEDAYDGDTGYYRKLAGIAVTALASRSSSEAKCTCGGEARAYREEPLHYGDCAIMRAQRAEAEVRTGGEQEEKSK